LPADPAIRALDNSGEISVAGEALLRLLSSP
jgi:hypothetical protein